MSNVTVEERLTALEDEVRQLRMEQDRGRGTIPDRPASVSPYKIHVIAREDAAFDSVLCVAQELDQAKYLAAPFAYAQEDVLLGAFLNDDCIGFLRFIILDIGSDEGRPPILSDGKPLREGFVEAFGVITMQRRQGAGQQLQETALTMCRARHCYQMRSRSPVTALENYALKVKMGYAIHPSNQNDSYYFIKVLTPAPAS